MAEIWSIVLPNLGWIVTLIALLGVSYKIGKWMQEVELSVKLNNLILA
jgi:hypothetical protein